MCVCVCNISVIHCTMSADTYYDSLYVHDPIVYDICIRDATTLTLSVDIHHQYSGGGVLLGDNTNIISGINLFRYSARLLTCMHQWVIIMIYIYICTFIY